MSLFHEFTRLFSELDVLLDEFIANYGTWTYGLLFAIVFCETGLVIMPFLPGDSLLFVAGALSARGGLDPFAVAATIFCAALAGDNVNWRIGRTIGPRAFSGRFRWLKREHLERTQRFFEKHGGKSIVLARFVPIVRTFAPFVAGVGAMPYPRFLAFSVLGAALWVGLLVGAGYAVGEHPWVKANLSKVILGIVALSVLPIAIEWWRSRRSTAKDSEVAR